MPKVIFSKDYDYHPSAEPRVTMGYKADKKPQRVNQECADRAIKAGVAVAVEDKPQPKKSVDGKE